MLSRVGAFQIASYKCLEYSSPMALGRLPGGLGRLLPLGTQETEQEAFLPPGLLKGPQGRLRDPSCAVLLVAPLEELREGKDGGGQMTLHVCSG